MTTTEFSNEFDLLYNNIASNQAPGLDAYEKSVFLTKAQEEIILALYSDKDNDLQSFEKTEELRRYLDSLIKTETLTRSAELNPPTISSKSAIYILPDDLWFITYEVLRIADTVDDKCLKGKEIEVIPITQDEYHRVKNNPFRGANDTRALRLDLGTKELSNATKHRVEIISNYKPIDTNYIVRYVAKANPIILPGVTLSIDGMSLDSTKTSYECELHPALHRLILDRAVRLAIASFTQNLQ